MKTTPKPLDTRTNIHPYMPVDKLVADVEKVRSIQTYNVWFSLAISGTSMLVVHWSNRELFYWGGIGVGLILWWAVSAMVDVYVSHCQIKLVLSLLAERFATNHSA